MNHYDIALAVELDVEIHMLLTGGDHGASPCSFTVAGKRRSHTFRNRVWIHTVSCLGTFVNATPLWRRCNINERAGNSVAKILGGLLEVSVDILIEVMHVLASLAVFKSLCNKH